MGFGDMVKIIQGYQDNSDIPFDIKINSKDKTIKIEYIKRGA